MIQMIRITIQAEAMLPALASYAEGDFPTARSSGAR